MEQLKDKARSLGLWNLFLSKEHYPDVGVPLTNLEYATMAEIMGHAPRVAPEACNCSAPDTGNMGASCRAQRTHSSRSRSRADTSRRPTPARPQRSSLATAPRLRRTSTSSLCSKAAPARHLP